MGEGYRRLFRVDNTWLLLLEQGGQRYLVEGLCPHQGQSLIDAAVGLHGSEACITCPRHQYCFSLKSGAAAVNSSGEACRALKVYDIVYEGNELGVSL